MCIYMYVVKLNKQLLCEDLLMTRFELKSIFNLCYNESHTNFLITVDNSLIYSSRKIFTLQEPQPCSPLLVGGNSSTLLKIGNDTLSKTNCAIGSPLLI